MGIFKKASLSLFLFVGITSGHFDCDSDKIREPEGNLIHKFLYDSVALPYELLSKDTLIVFACFAPLYGAGRLADKDVHAHFHCAEHHKDFSVVDRKFCRGLDVASLTLSVSLSLLAFNPWDKELARAGRVFAAGLAPLAIIKDIIKHIHHEGCLRPRCEFFDKHQRYYGGCPSGHMAFMAYATVFWGLEYGWPWAVPLGAVTATLFGLSVNCNRHFVSQLIAGMGLGVAFGIAGNKVMSCYKAHDYACDVVADDHGIGLQCTYSF